VSGREGGIRTRDLSVPNRARYQASLLPDVLSFLLDVPCTRFLGPEPRLVDRRRSTAAGVRWERAVGAFSFASAGGDTCSRCSDPSMTRQERSRACGRSIASVDSLRAMRRWHAPARSFTAAGGGRPPASVRAAVPTTRHEHAPNVSGAKLRVAGPQPELRSVSRRAIPDIGGA
jgi:hypothetical protein